MTLRELRNKEGVVAEIVIDNYNFCYVLRATNLKKAVFYPLRMDKFITDDTELPVEFEAQLVLEGIC